MRNAISFEEMDELANSRQQSKADKIRQLLTSDGVDSDTIEKFIEWFDENQSTWQAFKTYSKQAIASGKKLGAKAVSERVRWYAEIESNNEYKVNNNYVAYMARLFNANVRHEYFETRNIRGLKEAA